MAGKKRLSLKQKKFAEELVKTKNQTEAAMRSYNVKNRQTAALVGCKNLKKPEVIMEVQRIMEKKNITDDYLMQKLKEGLDANIVTDYQGEAEMTDIPDIKTRYKYWEAAAKMRGFLKDVTENRNINIDVELENMSPDQIQALIKSLSKQYAKVTTPGEEADFREDDQGSYREYPELGGESQAHKQAEGKSQGE